MSEFKNMPYVAIAIDEGKDALKKNLDFILENPFCKMEPYPYMALEMEDQSAEGYLPLLSTGLINPSRYGIKVAVVIADGNKAQKSVFQWNGKGLYVIHHHLTLSEKLYLSPVYAIR